MAMQGAPMLATDAAQASPPPIRLPIAWIIAIAVFVAFWLYAKPLAPAAFEFPKAWYVPMARWISSAMKWL
ncbi:MAG: hypothetical protein Q8S27_07175, partial [Hoeflea sp.]|nr:hypothetical protein [Hoeflea sp.]